MTPELAQLSDWVLALLPWLFFFPGGLWVLVGVGLMRLAERMGWGLWAGGDVEGADLLPLAVGWAGVALLPLPGASVLPTPVDRWALAMVFGVSLLLDWGGKEAGKRGIAQVGSGITLAIVAPLAAGGSLMGAGADRVRRAPLAAWLAAGAVGLGVGVMMWLEERGLAADVRGVGWIALALAPAYGDMWLAATGLVFGVAVVVGFVAGRAKRGGKPEQGGAGGWRVEAILWLPACLGLGALLLAGV
jgi:hypothetical protein